MTSTLPTSKPCAATSATARRSRSRLDASFQRGSESGKCRPMSPRHGGAENRVGHRVADDVGVGMPERAAVGRNRDAAEHERPAGDEAVQIVAGPGASGAGRGCECGCGCRGNRFGDRQILRRRDLDVRRLAVDEADRMAGALGQRRFVGRIDAALAPQRQRRAQHVAPKRLRRLREVDRLARQRLRARSCPAVSRPTCRTCRRASPCRATAPPRARRPTRRPRRSSARSDRRSRTAAPRRESR